MFSLLAPIMGQIPLHATVGGSVLIPCSLPVNSSESLKWFYWQEEQSHNFLFFWDAGGKTQTIPEKYRDRCEAFNTEFSSGNISIRLNDVVSVNVVNSVTLTAPYQDLVLTVNETAKRATCSARGGYPEPRVSWTGQNKSGSAQLQGALTELLQDPTEETFSVHSSVSVKDLQSVTCLIYNTHSTRTIGKTAKIDVPGDVWLDSPVGLGRCESSSELWCGSNKQTLVRLKTGGWLRPDCAPAEFFFRLRLNRYLSAPVNVW
uniref:Ig-like domain-containing protein n=1 Tax=Sander lucioperca TaxID=283035 RepID=A0A8C9YXV8_SANLU